jgi:hypothetical protein
MIETENVEIGPIDYLVVEWPPGRQPTGAALPMLVDLVDRGVIRLLDLAFLRRNEDGTVRQVELDEIGPDPELTMFEGASSGMIDDDDLRAAAEAIDPGASAALLIYENAWAAPFATAVRRGGAQLVATGRIPMNAIIATLDELEESDEEEEGT